MRSASRLLPLRAPPVIKMTRAIRKTPPPEGKRGPKTGNKLHAGPRSLSHGGPVKLTFGQVSWLTGHFTRRAFPGFPSRKPDQWHRCGFHHHSQLRDSKGFAPFSLLPFAARQKHLNVQSILLYRLF